MKKLIAVAALALLVGADGTQQQGVSLNLFNSQLGRSSEAVTPKDIADLASKTQKALDETPAGPNEAAVLQTNYAQLRGNGPDTIGYAFVPTVGDAILSDEKFRDNLQRLFQAQALDAVTDNQGGAELAPPAKMRVVDGSPISTAKDVIVIKDRLDDTVGPICSGILVDPSHVLTAGHCVCQGIDQRVQTGQTVYQNDPTTVYPVVLQKVEIYGGAQCPAKLAGEAADDYAARVARSFAGGDLAILPLTRSIDPSRATVDTLLGPNGLVAWRASAESYFVRIGGFGFNLISSAWPYKTIGGTLVFADLAIASSDCGATDQARYGCVPGKQLIAGANPSLQVKSKINTGNDPGACSGDSGGPAYAQSDANGGAFFPVAITSGGLSSTCGSGSVYTLLSDANVHSWLVGYHAQFTN